MIGRPGGPPLVSFSFAEGRFFDLWMVVHFLSGVAGGFSNTFFGLSAPQVFALGFLMMLGWEIGEHAQRVRESLANRALDVVVGLAGTALALVLSRGLSRGWVRVA